MGRVRTLEMEGKMPARGEKNLRNSRLDWFSSDRKFGILRIWRVSRGRVLTDGISEREILQWNVLEKKYGAEGLFLSKEITLEFLRVTPPPKLLLWARRNLCKSSRVEEVMDPLGFPIKKPDHLTGHQWWTYHVVRELSLDGGIATHADLAHLLWPSELRQLPKQKIIDVMMSHLNKKIFPEKIRNSPGRGFQLVVGIH